MTLDPDFAARAEAYRAQLEKDSKAPLMKLGPFTVETLEPVTSSKVVPLDRPPFATHRFSFELKDESEADWIVSCGVELRWISNETDNSIQELRCDLLDGHSEGKLPYKLTVTGVGPALGLKSGELSLGRPLLDISSAHAEADPPSSIGQLLGFHIVQDHIVLGTVQTVSPVTIWIDRSKPVHLQSLAAACAVALAYYESMAHDA